MYNKKYELFLPKNIIIVCIKELITFYKSSCFVTCANRCFQEAVDIYVVPAQEKIRIYVVAVRRKYIVKFSVVQCNKLVNTFKSSVHVQYTLLRANYYNSVFRHISHTVYILRAN